jgi:hypothetical protein
MIALAEITDRISPLIGKLGSPHDGEVLSAARALLRQLDKHGLSFNDLAIALKAEPVTHIVYRDRDRVSDWSEVADRCTDHPECLNAKEARWLNSILDRIREEMAT